MQTWEKYLQENRERHLDELLQFLRIPSISSLPDHTEYVRQAAEWVAERLKAAGLQSVEILPTGGHPVVYGEWLHKPEQPTVLIYGHFDTQPVDPPDLWNSPPFEPLIKDERIYARGASDDKGNLFIPITVAEALLKTDGRLPVNLKFLLEGQEEIGSPQLPDFIAANRDRLACDLVLSADGGQWTEQEPAIVLGTRGLAGVFIDVQGPDHDLHSGAYGGTVPNPIHALAQILETMHDNQGHVTVDGFYDDVRPLTKEESSQLARVPYDEKKYLAAIGAGAVFGEPGFSTYERAWARPTLEVNGIFGGFQGAGLKTVLPAEAHAKISCRLVADQDPGKIADLLLAHIKRVAPPGVNVEARKAESGARPYLAPADHPGVLAAAAVLHQVYDRQPYRIRTGGSIPANALMQRYLNAYTVIYSFGLPDERQHSPNEFFRLASYAKGQKAYGLLLHKLAAEWES